MPYIYMMEAYSAHYITDNVVIMFCFCSFHGMLYIVFMFKLSFVRLLFWCCTILMPPWGRYCVCFFFNKLVNLWNLSNNYACPPMHRQYIVWVSPVLLSDIVGTNISKKTYRQLNTHIHTMWNHCPYASSNGQSIRHESEGWGFEFLSGRDIFYLKNFDTFTRTSVRVSKMNVVARAQLIFQMITLLKISPVIISGSSDASTVKYHLNRSFNLFLHPFYNCAGNDLQIIISIRSCIVLW